MSYVGTPGEWLSKAEGDLNVARREASLPAMTQNRDAIAFHCQQAIEKLMKGILVSRGIEPPHIHDLAELARRLESAGVQWSWPMTEIRLVTMGAVHSRYPGYDISDEDCREIVRITQELWPPLRALV
jgi:HEPN domain-containing protein